MNHLEIYETHKTVEIPSCWDELSRQQIQSVFKLNDQAIRRGWSAGELQLRILMLLLEMKLSPSMVFRISRGGGSKELENLWMIARSCMAFLYQDGKIRFDSVRNPMPEVRVGLFGTPLTGPADLLSDLSFGEFRHAARALNTFFDRHDIADLDECLAHLYRKKSGRANKSGRFIKPFDGQADIKRASKMAPWQKNLAMAWFSSCLNYLQNGSIEIDGEVMDMKLLFSPDGAASSGVHGFTWNDMLLQVAKEHIIGTIDAVDESPLVTILQIMWSNYKEQKRYEKAVKSKKAK